MVLYHGLGRDGRGKFPSIAGEPLVELGDLAEFVPHPAVRRRIDVVVPEKISCVGPEGDEILKGLEPGTKEEDLVRGVLEKGGGFGFSRER